MSDLHRVVVKFDLDGEALGHKTHGHAENEIAAMIRWAFDQCGHKPEHVSGLRVKVRDSDA